MHLTHHFKKLIKYAVKGKSRFYLHSPFIYNLSEEVLNDKRRFYAFEDIQKLRESLLSRTDSIEVHDFGAGKKALSNKKVADITKKTSIAPRYGKLIFRFINHFKPKNMLELGTSLGISTAYQALANPEKKMLSIEGCPNVAKLALENLTILEANNVEIVNARFDESLDEILNQFDSLDYVFFDGNHKKEPTIKYFEACLKKVNNNSFFIFDDIHWSPEMSEAWEMIKSNPKCKVTIDLYQLGIVFFRKEQEKEDFMLWYW